jgi:hypothetical protein
MSEHEPFALARADAELVEAEREFQQLEAQIAALRAADADEDTEIDPVFLQWMAVMERIAVTPATSIVGAPVKLRTLLHKTLWSLTDMVRVIEDWEAARSVRFGDRLVG